MSSEIEAKIARAREGDVRRKKTARFMLLVAAIGLSITVGVAAAYYYVSLQDAAPVVVTVTGDGEAVDNSLREKFKSQLRIFQNEAEPALVAVSASVWAADVHAEIFDSREKSLRAFDVGNYSSAIGLLQNSQSLADKILQRAEEKFLVDFKVATAAFHAGDYKTANTAIADALLLKSEHVPAQTLRERIAVLPQVSELLEAAQQARVENRPEFEQDALAKILQLDPAREEVRERLQTVTADIAEKMFSDNIVAGFSALEKRDMVNALRHWNAAKKILPGQEEAEILGREIRDLDRKLSLQAHLRSARQAADGDDWVGALRSFQKARKIDDAHTVAVEGEKRARAILDSHKKINAYIAQPQRLSSSNVASAAENLLSEARAFYPFSLSLAQQGKKLAALLTEAATLATVTVRSDNKTEIRVRGVGVIGKTLQRVVSLRPGVYTFEGRRRGYRSKLMQVTVSHNNAPLMVTLVCDEQI